MKTHTILKTIEIGDLSKDKLIKKLEKDFKLSSYAKSMIESDDFTISKKKESVDLVKITPAEMGFTGYPTTDQIYQKAEELGLELCPPEVGPYLRLKYQNQPLGEWIYVGMKQITDSGGNPSVFELARRGDGLWLAALGRDPASSGIRTARSCSGSARTL